MLLRKPWDVIFMFRKEIKGKKHQESITTSYAIVVNVNEHFLVPAGRSQAAADLKYWYFTINNSCNAKAFIWAANNDISDVLAAQSTSHLPTLWEWWRWRRVLRPWSQPHLETLLQIADFLSSGPSWEKCWALRPAPHWNSPPGCHVQLQRSVHHPVYVCHYYIRNPQEVFVLRCTSAWSWPVCTRDKHPSLEWPSTCWCGREYARSYSCFLPIRPPRSDDRLSRWISELDNKQRLKSMQDFVESLLF